MSPSKRLLLPIIALLAFSACKEKPKDMSLKLNTPHNIHGVLSYKQEFDDCNDVQLPCSERLGIPQLQNRAQAEKMSDRLVLLQDTNAYCLDDLTHSIPFLVPRAANLLTLVGTSFLDSLQKKGLNPYQVVVTSVLRTREDIGKLCKRNLNAVEQSAHIHATTFDISWSRYHQVPDPDGRPLQPVRDDTLKMVLCEVLHDLKAKSLCYVKHERKQGCFHITAR
ncbi:MAG: hypothetical protein KBH23_01480 [Bacteroidaceae bacterium]|nr:hypothetical protein [Bacteroidaceae bacterium]MBP9637090.1 hypothetical protein [Bacteroidaceae bacterium]